MNINKTYFSKIKLISKDSDFFPKRLLDLDDCPDVLFVLGNEKILNTTSVSIVGTRNSSILGNEIAFTLSQNISSNQITIVSGMAKGIDTQAHLGALQTGKTIAIIACGFDYFFKSRDSKLITEIIKNDGAIISEYFPDTMPQAFTFLKRNRLIAAISDITIVVEAPIKSGSLNTAKTALNYNRTVFAIPWNINVLRGSGCNFLIQNQAHLLTDYKQILNCLKVFQNSDIHIETISTNYLNNFNSAKIKIPVEFSDLYNFIKDNEPVNKQMLYSTFSKKDISDLNSKLLLMELQDFIILKR